MNNPLQNKTLLQSPSSGPPISKKQRGGRTPGSIKARPRSGSGGTRSGMPRAAGPPTGGPPRSSTSSQASGGPPLPTGVVDDAIARRRAELRRLQEKARGAVKRTGASSGASSSAPPMARPSGPPTKRTSDIFPTAPKSPSLPRSTLAATKPIIPEESSTKMVQDDRKPPPTNMSIAASSSAAPPTGRSNPNLPPETPLGTTVPPTPAVGRRLEFPSSQKPAAPPTIASKETKPAEPPFAAKARRARSKSPTKTATPPKGSLPPSSKANPRAKSAPPRRPPGPPPKGAATVAAPPSSGNAVPPSKPAATSTAAKQAAKKKIKARRPAPVRPGSLLPSATAKKPASPPKKDKPPASSASSSEAPPTTASGPPPTTSSNGPPPMAVGTGSLDLSQMQDKPATNASAATVTETPKPQKSAANTSNANSNANSGAITPPSSGSSARRKKLQLLREQAAVASTLKTTKPAAAASGPPPTSQPATAAPPAAAAPPTKMSFYTGSEGGPSTEAFAKAIAPKNTIPEVPNLVRVPSQDGEPKKAAAAAPKSSTKETIKSLSKTPKASSSSSKSSMSAAQARLEDAYQKSERDKLAALVKIKELEDQLSQASQANRAKSKQQQAQQRLDVQRLLQVAQREGPQAALEWASKNNTTGSFSVGPAGVSRTGFDSMGGMGTSAQSAPSPHRRARKMAIRALQRPRTDHSGDPAHEETPEQTEKRLLHKFREAAQYVSYEFSSELATYIVRKPYGIPTQPQGLFDHCRHPDEDPRKYSRMAHVSDKTTVEVAAIAKADRTPLLIFGNAGIRYQTNASSKHQTPEWKHFDDVDQEDRPLGHITYIDGQANEKEYSLDEVLEEALLVREQYCGTLTSTALALPDPPAQAPTPAPAGKPPLAEVKTDSKPPSKEAAAAKQQQPPPPQQQQPQRQQPPPPDQGDLDSGSSDVLVVFLGMVVSTIFGLIWGIFIGTPLRIVRTTVVVVVACGILQMVHLYLADGYNDWALREFSTHASSSCSSFVASDLSWFSNQHPGIL